MAISKEGFRPRYIDPFKAHLSNHNIVGPASTWKTEWHTDLDRREGKEPFTMVSLTEDVEQSRYSLSVFETDPKHHKREKLMSMVLNFDPNGNLVGLENGGLTVYRVRGNLVYMFDYQVDKDNPSQVNLVDVFKSRYDASETSPLFMERSEKLYLVKKSKVPERFNWIKSAAYLLKAHQPGESITNNNLAMRIPTFATSHGGLPIAA